MSDNPGNRKGLRRATLGTLIAGILLGVLGSAGFIWTVEATNTEAFCLGCHEMQDYVYPAYKGTAHDFNRTGVRTTCPDCHVPADWLHKIARKVRSTKDVYHTVMGTIATPEKYAARRQAMADKVLDEMRGSDSRECRGCHDAAAMNPERQSAMTTEAHSEGDEADMTCIDCHDGIAHTPPEAR